MNELTQQNTTLVEEVDTASATMNAEAHELIQQVGHFDLDRW